MSFNTNLLNKFASGMADIQMYRNPLAMEVVLIYNDVIRDHYQDAVSTEEVRIKKMAMVKKDTDLDYVQQEFALLEDGDKLPWLVSMTTTGMPRVPRLDDQVLIEGRRYNISAVRPTNRQLESIVILFVYPERNDEDVLAIYSVSDLNDGYMDIIYGGAPIQMAFNSEAILNEELRIKFISRPQFPSELEYGGRLGTVYIFDAVNNYASLEYDLRV